MFTKSFNEVMASEFISLTGGVLAGFLLSFATDKLYLIPGLFILFPGFMEMRGNISGSMSARITSGLYVGAMKSRKQRRHIIDGNAGAAIGLGVALSVMLGVLAYVVSHFFFGVDSFAIIPVAIIAALLANVIEIPMTIAATLWLFKKGHDPNNIMGPYVTTVGDIVSVLALLIAIWVVV
ncbi:MAG TPA: magnesium transporter [archaeon]|nr:magnesium transporter [archaeon]